MRIELPTTQHFYKCLCRPSLKPTTTEPMIFQVFSKSTAMNNSANRKSADLALCRLRKLNGAESSPVTPLVYLFEVVIGNNLVKWSAILTKNPASRARRSRFGGTESRASSYVLIDLSLFDKCSMSMVCNEYVVKIPELTRNRAPNKLRSSEWAGQLLDAISRYRLASSGSRGTQFPSARKLP